MSAASCDGSGSYPELQREVKTASDLSGYELHHDLELPESCVDVKLLSSLRLTSLAAMFAQ